MSYVLPDEPRGAIRPELAVSAVWPLLTLMLVGPLAGFVWLAFNSWALGCRQAPWHTAVAAVLIPGIGLSVYLLGAVTHSAGLAADDARFAFRLSLIAVQSAALGLAFWIMWNQDEAEEWRRTYGPPPGNGVMLFAGLMAVRILAGAQLPAEVRIFAFWTGI